MVKIKKGLNKDQVINSEKEYKFKNYFKKIGSFIARNKYWFFGGLLVILIILGVFLSQTWLIQSSFLQAKTYPKASVLSVSVGNLDSKQLDIEISKLKSDFENKDITLTNLKDSWVFKPSKLGLSFDLQATINSVMQLNQLGFIDKLKLLKGDISSTIKPVLLVNNQECINALSVIPVVQTASEDALVYFDKDLKIKSDTSGYKFNAGLTCQELPKQLANNLFTHDVYSDVSVANITKADIELKFPQIQAMISEPLILKSGSYQQTFTTEQLLATLSITKLDSDLKIDWSTDKLDEVINNMAGKINTYIGASSLGGCQYLASNGGSWLDKDATKKIFVDLGTGKPRSYDLSVAYHEPVVKTRTPLAPGKKGTIYLTYDDGMTYSNQIMNYAACYGIKVTFFEIGMKAEADAVALRRAIAEGHAVQSHGYEHALYDYGSRSYDWQYEDMSKSINIIKSITGIRSTYFRPPGGNRSATTYDAASANGLSLILWGDASRDSAPTGVTSALTCSNVLAGAYPGASVLMHSTNKSTAEALPCIAEGLAARGYSMSALR